MEFITDETVMLYCQGCAMLETRISRKSNRSYLYCKSYQSVCFKCLDDCKQKIHADEIRGFQKSLTEFGGV